MTYNEKEDVKIILDYLWSDEETHYQSAPCKKHIFSVLKRLAKKTGYEALNKYELKA
jgi:uncharacterized protein YdaU (DUF1376 family)